MITGIRHSDPAVQREFERIQNMFGDSIAAAQQTSKGSISAGSPSSTTSSSQVISGDYTIITGYTSLNILAKDPATMPANYPSSKLYLYANYDIRPENGNYGWYVYNIIEHGMHLTEPTDFIIEFYDADELKGNIAAATSFPFKRAFPHYEPMDRDRILVSGILKPGILVEYKGHDFTQQLDYVDESRGIVTTNLNFYYTMIGKTK